MVTVQTKDPSKTCDSFSKFQRNLRFSARINFLTKLPNLKENNLCLFDNGYYSLSCLKLGETMTSLFARNERLLRRTRFSTTEMPSQFLTQYNTIKSWQFSLFSLKLSLQSTHVHVVHWNGGRAVCRLREVSRLHGTYTHTLYNVIGLALLWSTCHGTPHAPSDAILYDSPTTHPATVPTKLITSELWSKIWERVKKEEEWERSYIRVPGVMPDSKY